MVDDDVMDRLLAIRPGSRLDAIRDERPEVRRATQANFEALFGHGGNGLTAIERDAAAYAVALLHDFPALTFFHRARLMEMGAEATLPDAIAHGGPLPPRLSAIIDHARLVARRPVASGRAQLEGLRQAGLTPEAIVSLSQIIGFLAYQIRVAAGLKLLELP